MGHVMLRAFVGLYATILCPKCGMSLDEFGTLDMIYPGNAVPVGLVAKSKITKALAQAGYNIPIDRQKYFIRLFKYLQTLISCEKT